MKTVSKSKQEFDKNANDNVYFSELYYCIKKLIIYTNTPAVSSNYFF